MFSRARRSRRSDTSNQQGKSVLAGVGRAFRISYRLTRTTANGVASFYEASRQRSRHRGARKHMEKAEAFLAAGQMAEAITECDQAIALDPEYAYTYYRRAGIHGSLGELDPAIEDYSQAIRRNPTMHEAYYGRAQDLMKVGQAEMDVEDYTQCIRLSPTLQRAYYLRGIAYQQVGRVRQGIDDFARAIRLDAQDAAAFFSRGQRVSEDRPAPAVHRGFRRSNPPRLPIRRRPLQQGHGLPCSGPA